ncbi:MAG TPA: DUF4870 domain-containing protein [Oleiagrimonas sp.]|nr:DUF4870 domain-containing protein [Oleiagrimonas sp.]
MNVPSDQMPPPSPPPSFDDGGPSGNVDDRNIAMLTHLSGLLLSIVVPLIVWLVYKDRTDKTYLVAEAKEALNFQVTVLIGYVICTILTIIVIGAFLAWLLWLVNLCFCIWAAFRVSNTGTVRYPYSLRLVN